METIRRKSLPVILVYCTLFPAKLLFIIMPNNFERVEAYFENISEAILRLSLLEKTENCSTPKIQNGLLYTACRNYDTFPRNIPNSTDIQVLHMSLDNNKIHTLTEGELFKAKLLNLVKLELYYCEIQNIEKGAFSAVTSTLEELLLSGNQIEILDLEVFAGLTKLKILELGGNPIKISEAGSAFPSSLTSLIKLDLGNYQLDTRPENLLSNLKLQVLRLDVNLFKFLAWHSFSKTTVSEQLTLFENPWHCDCNVKFLIDDLLENGLFNENEQVICATSPNDNYLAGTTWLDVDRDKLACLPQLDKIQLASSNHHSNKTELQDFLDIEGQLTLPMGRDVYVKCIFSGYPQPQVQLKKVGPVRNDTEASHSDLQSKIPDSNTYTIELGRQTVYGPEEWRYNYTYEYVFIIKDAKKNDSGRYSCHGSNFAGYAEKTFDLNLTDESGNGNWKIYLGVGIAFVALSVIAFALWLKVGRGMECVQIWRKNKIEVTIIENVDQNMVNFEFDHKLELDIWTDIFIDINSILGSGNFGTVYKGRVRGEDVAIKRLNTNTSSVTINSLISELKILCYVGTHANVVGFIGAYTKEISKGILYIVTELCNNGSLLEFLRTKKLFVATNNNTYTSIQPNEFISLKNLCNFSCEIAKGMDYIATKKVTHGDLSARNVLLDAENVCKIGDFGLARKLYGYQKYVKKSDDPLPWKWMAYESLTKMEFTSMSDVWSYGVSLWEIFSLGNVPFAGLRWTTGFAEGIRNGLRLSVPQNAPAEIYYKMLECWKLESEDRPLFSDMVTFFQNFQETIEDTSNSP